MKQLNLLQQIEYYSDKLAEEYPKNWKIISWYIKHKFKFDPTIEQTALILKKGMTKYLEKLK